MNTLAELLQQGRTEELQERLNPYIYKINNFYQQANTILQTLDDISYEYANKKGKL